LLRPKEKRGEKSVSNLFEERKQEEKNQTEVLSSRAKKKKRKRAKGKEKKEGGSRGYLLAHFRRGRGREGPSIASNDGMRRRRGGKKREKKGNGSGWLTFDFVRQPEMRKRRREWAHLSLMPPPDGERGKEKKKGGEKRKKGREGRRLDAFISENTESSRRKGKGVVAISSSDGVATEKVRGGGRGKKKR